jgi:hypothetical protein
MKMRERDEELAALLTDLRALSGRQKRAVLGSLSQFERVRVQALLSAAPDEIGLGGPQAMFSPSVASRIAAARSHDTGQSACVLTDATRHLLLELAERARSHGDAMTQAPAKAPPKSLMAALASFVAPARVAR